MAIIRKSEVKKMSKKDLDEKIKELRLELVKAGVTAKRATAKTRELKRALARCIFMNNSVKKEAPKKE